MGNLKNKSKGPDPNLANNPPASSTSTQPNSNSQSRRPPVEQRPKQAALSPPTPTPSRSRSHSRSRSRSRRFFRKLGCFSSPPSPRPGVVDVCNSGDNHTAPPVSQSLAVPTSALPRPHSSPPGQKTLLLFDHGPSSPPGFQGSPLASTLSAPVSSAPVSTPIIREPIDIESPAPVKVDVCAVEPPMDPASTEPCSSPVSASTIQTLQGIVKSTVTISY